MSLANIYCERSIFTIITTTWRETIAGQLEKHVLKAMLLKRRGLQGVSSLRGANWTFKPQVLVKHDNLFHQGEPI